MRTIYTVRAVSFAWCLLVVVLHGWERGFGAGPWVVAAVLHFLAYPHLVYQRAARARDPRAAEIHHLQADSFLLGIWVAVLQFPAVDRLSDGVRAGAERHGQPRPARVRPVARAELPSASSPACC